MRNLSLFIALTIICLGCMSDTENPAVKGAESIALKAPKAYDKAPETYDMSGGFTIVVLPDTQKYSKSHPEIFTNQTLWIVENKDKLDIAFVAHVGDIVNNKNSETEWSRANESMSVLDGVVPYGFAPGNHDQSEQMISRFFPPERMNSQGNYGVQNTYQLFSAGAEDFIVVNLGFCPKEDDLSWAKNVLSEHQSRKAILVTHAYMDGNGFRLVHTCGSTQKIWDDVIATSENVFLVLCGHVHTEAHRVDKAGDRRVAQLLADYQDERLGGEGYLRIMRFSADAKTIKVKTYSPYLGRYKDDSDSRFDLLL
jgi:calcineurin-like phosphoesterase family protein